MAQALLGKYCLQSLIQEPEVSSHAAETEWCVIISEKNKKQMACTPLTWHCTRGYPSHLQFVSLYETMSESCCVINCGANKTKIPDLKFALLPNQNMEAARGKGLSNQKGNIQRKSGEVVKS